MYTNESLTQVNDVNSVEVSLSPLANKFLNASYEQHFISQLEYIRFKQQTTKGVNLTALLEVENYLINN